MSERPSGREALEMIVRQLALEAKAYGARLGGGIPAKYGESRTFYVKLTLEIEEPVGPPLGPPLPLGVQVSEQVRTEDEVG